MIKCLNCIHWKACFGCKEWDAAIGNPCECFEEINTRIYTRHEVAVILAEEYGDTCACNFNGNDEWLPLKCELLDACPKPVGVACWEQFLKWRDCKEDLEE